MSKHAKHVAKHRAAPTRPGRVEAPGAALGNSALRKALVLTSVAAVVTGVAIAPSLLGPSSDVAATAGEVTSSTGPATGSLRSPLTNSVSSLSERALSERSAAVSRSDRRQVADPAKVDLLQAEGPAMARTEDLSDNDPRDIGQALLAEFGFSSDQFGCLDSLWTRESNWNIYADNPSSSAYGIPQSLPGSKMASAGADWATNPVTQIRWGLGYIQDRYGSPCGAWGHSQSHGWY